MEESFESGPSLRRDVRGKGSVRRERKKKKKIKRRVFRILVAPLSGCRPARTLLPPAAVATAATAAAFRRILAGGCTHCDPILSPWDSPRTGQASIPRGPRPGAVGSKNESKIFSPSLSLPLSLSLFFSSGPVCWLSTTHAHKHTLPSFSFFLPRVRR